MPIQHCSDKLFSDAIILRPVDTTERGGGGGQQLGQDDGLDEGGPTLSFQRPPFISPPYSKKNWNGCAANVAIQNPYSPFIYRLVVNSSNDTAMLQQS